MKPLSFNEPPATDAIPNGPAPGGRRRPLWIVLGLIVLALIAWGAYKLFFTKEKAVPPPPPVQATLAPATSKDMTVYIAGVGNVMPNQTVTVKARVDGQLQTLGYTEGQDVKQGQLIAQIDPRPFQATLAQVSAQKGKDEATLANARIDLTRYDQLIKEEATSQQQLDTQKALVKQLEATVKTDDAQIAAAKTQLDYTTITAPISGRTGLRLVDIGNIVHASDTTGLVVIDQVDPISVVFTLPDAAFQRVNGATRASTTPLEAVAYSRDDNNKPLAKGKLVLVDNHIDTTSGTVQIKAEFPNANHVLWPGQYVNVRLFVETRKGATVIPSSGVQRSQKGTYAWIVGDDNKAVQQPIEVALIQDGQAIIDKGVAPGQRVVIDGVYKVKPGVQISAAPPGAAPGSGSGGSANAAADPKTATSNPAETGAPENNKK
jgi:membrane fusion protein, multidrug efflux system